MMNFFKKRLAKPEEAEVDSRIEIVANQEATRSQIEDIKHANETIKKVFDENHFRLYLVVGGKNPRINKGKVRKV